MKSHKPLHSSSFALEKQLKRVSFAWQKRKKGQERNISPLHINTAVSESSTANVSVPFPACFRTSGFRSGLSRVSPRDSACDGVIVSLIPMLGMPDHGSIITAKRGWESGSRHARRVGREYQEVNGCGGNGPIHACSMRRSNPEHAGSRDASDKAQPRSHS